MLLPVIHFDLVSVLRASINVLSKSKSKNYVTWIANLTKLFLSVYSTTFHNFGNMYNFQWISTSLFVYTPLFNRPLSQLVHEALCSFFRILPHLRMALVHLLKYGFCNKSFRCNSNSKPTQK